MTQYPWSGIVGWTYDASYHCNEHAIARFGEAMLFDHDSTDAEGNPIHPVFSWDELGDDDDSCDECVYESVRARSASHSDQDIDSHNAEQNLRAATEAMREADAILNDEPYQPTYAQVVTPTGVQYLLPGETPPAVKKGDATDQTRMF